MKKSRVSRQTTSVRKGTKISKTIRLDSELVDWLVAEADRRGGKYQTLINSLLREAMEGGDSVLSEEQVRQIVREELARRVS